ncbi:uncharacterized protein SPSK_10648 [Sporothrix schenckii 1099-18]|uniref:Uncharacterized protein n=1 Tax=Sporothrix schenckii 1099-18 TaxID=1397361 RepID=A0A0F2LV04_SPOSC|nr:uncharacterized protein SPSK_10648 [Sporothrix schenckii 1099-18]KJR80335.1 hypothetical protein SPSK_10648 [Sporothrix schenckii 1099-18]
MDRVQGVTFFFSGARLFGIHSHVSEGASALSTYEGIPTGCRRGMVWIYLPMPRSDQLLVLGVRAKSSSSPCVNILIRTRLAGDVVIGQHSPGGVKDRCLGRSAPITLICGESKVGFPVPHFGAYCQFSADARLPEPFPLATSYHSLIGSDAYFSWASLSGITSALTYYDSKTGFCRGILLQYDNGGARTLGQCRRQVDPAEEVYKTRMLCWRTEMYRSQRQRMVHRTQVRFQHDPQHEHDNKWKCHALEGVLHFWFTDEATFLVVIN